MGSVGRGRGSGGRGRTERLWRGSPDPSQPVFTPTPPVLGCPIHEATRRGLGAALLRNTRKLARLVAGIADGSPLPLTVKIRTGLSSNAINVDATVAALAMAGVAAVTVHGRTQEQRYKRAADWGAIQRVAAAHPGTPVVGNGDVLAWWEAAARLAEPGLHACMVGRGALVKPWLFEEVREGREWLPTAAERVAVYRRLLAHFKEYLGDDAKGWAKAQHFLPSHFDFLCRYRPLPQAVYGPGGRLHSEEPLMGRRLDVADAELGETLSELSPSERLLRCAAPGAHAALAGALWDAKSDDDAVRRVEAVAATGLDVWEEEARAGERDDDNDDGRAGG